MSNSFYNHGAFPSTGSAATSASMRAELDLVAAGFDKMPTLSGNANKFIIVNSTGTALTQTDVLPAFTVTDTDFTVQDDGDNTRKFQFNAGSITTGNTRVYVMPDLDTTLVGTNVTQTLTNKTLTAPVIATIVNTGTLTLPTSTDTLVGRNTTDTLTNKTLTNPVIGTIVNTGTLTLPTSTDTLVGRQTTDTLTNKTISGASNTLSNIANGSLSNSSVVIGSTTLSLGGTMTTLAGVTISGASNTLSNIANASLTNSSITINGSTVALGSSVTVTATATNALTIGNGLSGTSYNGSSAVTIAINTGVTADLSTAQTFSNKTISGSANTLTNIANASLTNSAITIGSTAISLGATSLTLAGLTSASATTLISTGNQATSVAISAIGHSSGTVTVTTSTAHGLTTGDTASIDGVADYTFCGVYTVTVTNANVFTYSQTASGASSSGGFSTKLTGTWGLYAGGTGPSLHNGPVIVSASSQMPALRVTQGGSGYALIVEDAANPDTSAFIISNAGDLAINTNKFTVAAASGNTLVAGTLDATGNFNVNTNKFSVVAASGNTLVAGTLDATGNFNVNTNKFSVVAASGNTTIAGTTSFGGNIVSNLLFTDATYDIGASGATRPRDLFLSRNLVVGGTLTLAGGVNLNGNVTIGDASTDTLTINGTAVSVPNNLNFDSNTLFIDATNNRVGVNTNGPSELFDVYNGRIQNSGNNNTAFDVYQTYASAFPTNEKYWRTQVYTDGTVGTTQSRFQFVNDAYGAASTWMSVVRNGITLSSVTFNEDSNDADFRIESDGNTHAFFLDGGVSTVNINSSVGSRPSGGNGISLQIGVVSSASQIYHYGTTADKGFITGTASDNYIMYEGPSSGVFNNRFEIVNGGELVINQSSLDRDTRIETTGRPYAFFVDASANTIGINNSTPVGDLDVSGSTGVYLARSGGTGSDGRVLYLKQFNDYGYSFNIDSSSTGKLFIKAVNAGVESSLIEWDRTGIAQFNYGSAVFNEGGADYDFRVESDTNTHALFVDGGSNTVGILSDTIDTSHGTRAVQIGSATGINTVLTISAGADNTNDRYATLVLRNTGNGGATNRLIYGVNDTTPSSGNIFNIMYENPSTGIATTQAKFTSTEVVLNDDSLDQDFRVESDGNTHCLFVDAGNNAVAINSASVFAGAALNVYNGGILNYVNYSLSGTTVVPISQAMTGGLYVMRDDANGGTCLVLYENGGTPIIVSQSSVGNYTTGTPSGLQIKLSANGSAGIGASMASGQTATLRVMALICDPN